MGIQGERGTEVQNHGMREGFSRDPHFIIDSVFSEFAAEQFARKFWQRFLHPFLGV
jgi:hypothetical protein